MRLVYEGQEYIARWVAARIPQMAGVDDFGPCSAIGIEGEDGKPIAGVVFHNYFPHFGNVEMSVASESPRWLTKRLIQAIMKYPFEQLDCRRVTSMTPKKNAPTRTFLTKFGFTMEGKLRKGFGDDDLMIYGLMRREFRLSRWVNGHATPNAVGCENLPDATPPEGDQRATVPAYSETPHGERSAIGASGS